MGDMADLLLDWNYDGDEMCAGIGNKDGYYNRPPKVLRCNYCNKSNLIWKNILRHWVIFEKDDKVHICEKYEPPMEILKIIALKALEVHKTNSRDKLFNKCLTKGNYLKKSIGIISDDDLLYLYEKFLKREQHYYDEPDIGMPSSYNRQISIIKQEILRRMI